MLDTSPRLMDAGLMLLDTSSRLLDTKLLATERWSLYIARQMLSVWTFIAGHWLTINLSLLLLSNIYSATRRV